MEKCIKKGVINGPISYTLGGGGRGNPGPPTIPIGGSREGAQGHVPPPLATYVPLALLQLFFHSLWLSHKGTPTQLATPTQFWLRPLIETSYKRDSA